MKLVGIVRNKRLWVVLTGIILSAVFVLQSGAFLQLFRQDTAYIYRGRILSVDEARLVPDPLIDGMYVGRQTIEIVLLQGDFSGQRFVIENTMSRYFNHHAVEGMELLFAVNMWNNEVHSIEVYSHSRGQFLLAFVAIFIMLLILVARKRGLYAILSMLFALSTVAFFMIPGIASSGNPLVFALITGAIIAAFSTFLVQDVSKKAIASFAATIFSISIVGVIVLIAGYVGNVDGLDLEHAEELVESWNWGVSNFRITHLLAASTVVIALGVVMHVSMAVVNAVFVTEEAKDMQQLFKAGMEQGRDKLTIVLSVLLLAFLGSSVVILLLIAFAEASFMLLINLDLIAVAVMQIVGASFGIVLAVPLAAISAAFIKQTKF